MAAVPSTMWRMLDGRISGKEFPTGMDATWDRCAGFFGRYAGRQKRYLQKAENVISLEKEYCDLSTASLQKAAMELHGVFRCYRESEHDVEKAFALIREVAYRKIGEKAYKVQIAGAFALLNGCVAEMATGEGKTLTSTMPAIVAGWRGKGCHVITVNDYLARRDAEWMSSIYRFCGLKVGHIEQETDHAERQKAYAADITYCTNKEVAADFLRDRLVLGRIKSLSSFLLAKLTGQGRGMTNRLVQRGLHTAIVDEADSILVDEAITPLIISGESSNDQQTEAFSQGAEIARELIAYEDYEINHHYREVEFTEQGKGRLKELANSIGGIWKSERRRYELCRQALTAKELYVREKHYVIDEDKIVIVDEFTGRLMPDRSWREGLHQAIEAKENLEVTSPKETFARISFQRFFRMYEHLSGMTGTGAEAESEFWQIYHLPVVVIPTNRPCVRKQLPDMVFTTKEEKWKVIVSEILKYHATERPILVGTRSVKDSEYLSGLLNEKHLGHQVLNAVYHRQEAQIVAGAGQPGKITVATNMAGRGTDIKLGRGIAEKGGLHVIASERNESGRIDRQLFGRCARQGNPGSGQAIISLEDEFVCRYMKSFNSYLRKRYKGRTEDISGKLSNSVFRLAQKRAEGIALRQRKSVMKTDRWLDEQLGFAGTE